jgi:hypothetical protein
MIEKCVCGFQDGADIGGIRAAKATGLQVGGWIARGWLTESGPHPEYADLYGAKECPTPGYPQRTRRNIRDSDATIVFARFPNSPGTRLTIDTAYEMERPSVVVKVILGVIPIERPTAMAGWLRERGVKVVNIAGNRESKVPGICAWVERYLTETFRILKGEAAS